MKHRKLFQAAGRRLLPAAAVLFILPAWGGVVPKVISSQPDGYLERARIMMDQGNYAGVIDQIGRLQTARIVLDDARHQEVAYMLAKALYRRGDAACVEALRKFASMYPASPLALQARLEAADYYFFAHKFGNSLAAYNDIDFARITPAERPVYEYRRALSQVRCGLYDDALPAFKALATDKKLALPAKYYIAYIDYVRGDYDPAYTAFEDISKRIGREGTDGLAPEHYMAQIDYARGDWQKAADNGERLLERDTDPALIPDTQRIVGLSLFKLGDYQRAERFLNQYMAHGDITPADDAVYALGVMDYAEGDLESASRRFARLTDLDNDLAQSAYLYLGQIAVRNNDTNAAAISFQKASALDFDPEVTETAMFNYIAARTHGGNVPFSSSIPLLTGFLSRFPNSQYAPQARQYLAMAYFNEKNYAKALESINRIPRPDNETLAAKQKILYELGMQCMSANRPAEARKYLAEAVGIAGDSNVRTQCQLWLGDACWLLGDYKAAANAYQAYLKAGKRTANNTLALYNLAYAELYLDRYAESAKTFRRALEANPPLPARLADDARIRMADAQYYAGDYRRALDNYSQAIDNGAVDSDYATYRRAVMYGLGGDLKKKIAELDAMPSRFPDSKWLADAMLEKGQTYAALGDTDRSVAAFEELRRVHSQSVQARKGMLNLAIAYTKAGNAEKAEESYREIITRWPSSDEARLANDDLRAYYARNGRIREYAAFLNGIDGAPRLDADQMEALAFEGAETVYAADVKNTALLERYVEDYPDGDNLAQALLDIATGRDEAGDTDAALGALDRLLTNRPSAPQVPEALSLKAQILETAGASRRTEAADTYRLLERTGGAEYAADAYAGIMRNTDDDRERLRYASMVKNSSGLTADQRDEAEFYEASSMLKAGDTAAAVRALQALAKNPNSLYGAQAAVTLGEHLLANGDINGADKVLAAFTDAGSPHQYWLARGFIALADVQHARGKDYLALEYIKSLRDNYPGDELDIHDMISSRLKKWKQ